MHISYLTEALRDPAQLDEAQTDQFVSCCGAVVDADVNDVVELLDAMQMHCRLHQSADESRMGPLLGSLVLRQHRTRQPISEVARDRIVSLYAALGELSHSRWRLLQWLATSAEDGDLRALVEIAVAHPPSDSITAARALTPLVQHRDYDPTPLFPKLFAALQHLSIAAPVLDLSNYLTRSGMDRQHPAAERGGQLAGLLGSLVQQLARIEESPDAAGESSAQKLGKKVDECVALVVSLCDALALLGDDSAIGKLYQALDLHHRRNRAR